MTRTQRNQDISKITKLLGWSSVEIKNAGQGCNWELGSKKSQYALTYIKDGSSKVRLVHNGNDYLYWLLKAETRQADCRCGDGLESVSNYGSAINQTCSKCMGYYKGKKK
mgnify:FL=1|jgi:hypothetical protein